MAKENNQNSESSFDGAWITIGSFDGIHRGHQQIIRKLVQGAHREKQQAVVITFYPNPAVVLRSISTPYYLTAPEEKSRILHGMGVDSVLAIKFDKDLSQKTAEEFMVMLHGRLKFSCLLIGYDFRLGANREGDIHKLEEIGGKLGYCVRSMDPVEWENGTVSSSRIREYLHRGDVSTTAEYLGRYYEIKGEVVHGDGRGKHIGLHTANIQPWKNKIIPSKGVYAAYVRFNGKIFQSVVNIGSRPTFYDHPVEQTIEIYILDFDEDIYGSNLRLFFVEFIRPEEKYDSVEALMDVIRNDITHAREVLSNAPAKKYIPA
jgi:riboflavin kinase/FMN adenylyltransferase